MFDRKSVKSEIVVLYYSGHGEENSGTLHLYGENNTRKPVHFSEIAEMWENRENKKLKYLFIILDSCYSFKWIE